MGEYDSRPRLRVSGKNRKDARVFLQCSECSKDIREIKPHESISVTRAYHCEECNPGVIVLNPPHPVSNNTPKDD